MRAYIIEVSTYIPAPRRKEYREVASSEGAAVARALRKNRKEYPRKRPYMWTIKITTT